MPSHASAPLQTSASAQLVPTETETCFTPSAGSQLSEVHGFWSSVSGGVPEVQAPAASQTSAPLQRLESEQVVPGGTGKCCTPAAGLQLSAVQGLPSSSGGGVPELQVPVALQVSSPLQRSASSQRVPAGRGLWVTPLDGSQASVVHGF
jgi:hypothetical protein